MYILDIICKMLTAVYNKVLDRIYPVGYNRYIRLAGQASPARVGLPSNRVSTSQAYPSVLKYTCVDPLQFFPSNPYNTPYKQEPL